ncbi:MAG TPA: hypothetical protein VGB43_02995 [Flavobacterium sp.]|jgi:hypothetical protein
MLIFYHNAFGLSTYNGAERQAGNYFFEVPSIWTNSLVHIWIAFSNPQRDFMEQYELYRRISNPIADFLRQKPVTKHLVQQPVIQLTIEFNSVCLWEQKTSA